MGKQQIRKQTSVSSTDDSNLQRFKDSVYRFSGVQNKKSKSPVKQELSRKEKRKNERKFKKMRRNAYHQKVALLSQDALEKGKALKEEEEKKRKMLDKKERMKKSKKKQKKRKQERKKEEEDTKKKSQTQSIKVEDREIKKYEKLLHLNKRKTNTISVGFKNDGLDYLLEAVDSEYLQTLTDEGQQDAPEGPLSFLTDSESDQSEEEDSVVSSEEDEQNKEKTINKIMQTLFSKKTQKSSLKEKSSNESKKTVSFVEDDSNDNIDNENTVQGDESISDDDSDDDLSDIEGDLNDIKDSNNSDSEQSEEMIENLDESKTMGDVQSKKMKRKPSEGSNHDQSGTVSKKVKLSKDVESESESGSGSEEESEGSEESPDEPQYTEDIYGRLRDKAGNVVESLPAVSIATSSTKGAYVPPGRRAEMAGNTDAKKRIQIENMKKKLKGLINRLSESNLQGIGNQVEEIFRAHSRAEACTALTEAVLGACLLPYLVPDRLTSEHCMLLALLHNNIGTEIGGSFLQCLGQKYKSMFENNGYAETKEMDNLMVIFSNLYNFKVVHSLLLFDIMKKFAERFGERDIEILLIILRTVGFTLRKDDPVALKDFIQHIQTKAAQVDTSQFQEKSRVQFMLETILHIKNNNMRKIPNYDPTHLDHLRKLLRNYIRGSPEAPLRIPLDDLYQADDSGKWWLVGSAWAGREKQDSTQTVMSSVGEVSAEILELARRQRMNTDVRRNIFCVIMTCEDYVDAFEKLLRLGLKNQQEREIIHVVVDLCLQEAQYNPFYSHLTQKFCEYDRRFQMTLQFNLWDKFKEMSALSDQKIKNMSKLLTHVIATKAMSLSVFKVLEFSELDKPRVRLMKNTLSAILLDYEDHVTRESFSRIAPFEKLHMLREGLKLFMRHFILRAAKRDSKSVGGDDKLELLTERIEMAEKALGSLDTQLRM